MPSKEGECLTSHMEKLEMAVGRTPRQRTQWIEPIRGECGYFKNGLPLPSLDAGVVASWWSVMDDFVVHDYFNRKARGEILFNSMNWEFTKTSNTGFGAYSSTSLYPPYDEYQITGALTSYEAGRVTPLVYEQKGHNPEIDDLVAEAKFEALSRVDDTPFGFGEDVGEIRETLRHLRNPLRGLETLSRKFKRSALKYQRKYGRIHGVTPQNRDLEKAIADSWLEYRFAIAPLVRSSIDLAQAVVTIRPQRKRSVARGSARQSSTESEDLKYTLSSSSHFSEFKRTRVALDHVRTGILYEVTTSAPDALYTLGLRAQDIPHTVWQLVPYSFMVDRMFDISGAIRGLTALANPNVKFLAGWVVHKKERKLKLTCTNVQHPAYETTVRGDTKTLHAFDFSRNGWTPSVSDTVPEFKPLGLVEDITKTADLAALVYKNLRVFER